MLKGPKVVSPQPAPLNISQELLDKGLDILFDAIKAVESG